MSRLLISCLLSLVLIACGGQSIPAEAAVSTPPAPLADAPAARIEPAISAAPEPAAAPVQAAPATTTVAAPRPRPVEIPGLIPGQDYDIIEGGQRLNPGENIEVAEVFAYWCHGCAQIAPLIDAWKPRLPAGTHFIYIPMVSHPQDVFPRAFYAAEASGILDTAHAAVFRAFHVERRLGPRSTADDIAAFLAQQGGHGTAQEIKSMMESFAVSTNLGRARQFAIRNGVSHTPMLIINGQYRVKGQNYQDQLRIADRIIAHLLSKTS